MQPWKYLKIGIALALLFFQVGAVIYSRFHLTKYFSSAPNDAITKFRVHVSAEGKELTQTDIQNRYRFFKYGWDDRSPAHIFDIITQYETTYGKEEKANVVVNYTVNGKEQRPWHYPQ
jgi:hypothetical protein